MHFPTTFLTALCLIPSFVSGQLSGPAGPKTTIEQKRGVKVCDVTQFGAKADKSTDLGPALFKAHAACKGGGVVVIPKGDYAMSTWVKLAGGAAWALQLDGVIYRTGKVADNMIMIEHTRDVEVFSGTGGGAIQGNGFEFHQGARSGTGPRLLRFWDTTDFSAHDFALVDSPSFHLVIDTCTNGEIYNLVIRGGFLGGTDGIDVWGTNLWIHDCMITNKDECVTVKSPSKFLLIESIYCNWSGGCGLGSLPANTDISNIHYKNVYTVSSNAMILIKSKGGGGTVANVKFENFIGHGNAYGLDIDQNWMGQKPVSGNGVQITGIVATNWKGRMANGAQRGYLKAVCADAVPCKDVTLEDVVMGTEQGNQLKNECKSAYGKGGCLKPGAGGSYPSTSQLIDAPASGYEAPRLEDDLKNHFGTTQEIPIPAFPKAFFPGIQPLKPLAAGGGGGGGGGTTGGKPQAQPAAAAQNVKMRTT
ncbi:RGase B [Phyllosticta capitalensis]